MEEGEEVAGDKEGFLGKREGVEVVDGDREEGWGGEEGDEAVAVVVEGGGEGGTKGGELGGGESGEGSHDDGFHIMCVLVTHDHNGYENV